VSRLHLAEAGELLWVASCLALLRVVEGEPSTPWIVRTGRETHHLFRHASEKRARQAVATWRTWYRLEQQQPCPPIEVDGQRVYACREHAARSLCRLTQTARIESFDFPATSAITLRSARCSS